MSERDNQTTARTVMAASLCNATNGVAAWDALPPGGRPHWLHRADEVIRELAAHEWMLVAIDEVQNV
jgi:hypothetical protein